MSAALKSYIPRPTPTQPDRDALSGNLSSSHNQSATALAPRQRKIQAQPSKPVPFTPASPPQGLGLLSKLQLLSSVLAAASVGLVMVSYGASVYVERQLEQSSQRLNQLQRGEQQLTTANEVLKSHMAKQADSPAVELTPPTPNHVIFLRPAHQRSQSGGAASASPRLALPSYSRPLGY